MAADKILIIANWKMNLNMHESSLFVHKLAGMVKTHRNIEVVLAPSLFTLQSLSLQVNHRQFQLAAQNFYWRDHGAYTGEVSATQLRGIVQYGLVGHSERRHVFHETDKDTRAKVQAAIRNDITPVLCVGETTHERSIGETLDVIHDQLIGGLANVTGEELVNMAIAYEPVWAIGSGQNALPGDVASAVKGIRRQIKHLYGPAVAEKVRVLYGGSVTADSVASYLDIPEVDGFIVGGASLDAQKFSDIIEAAFKARSSTK